MRMARVQERAHGGLLAAAPAYYVDPAGSDGADGKTPATAWASLSKVSALGSGAASLVVGLKRGGLWRGGLVIPAAGMTLCDYGDPMLANPRILGSTHLTTWTTAAATTPDKLVQGFEGAGLPAGWSQSLGTGSASYAYARPGSVGGLISSAQCARFVGAANQRTIAYTEMGAAVATSYFRARVWIDSYSIGSNGNGFSIAGAGDGPGSNNCWSLDVVQTTTGPVLALEVYKSGGFSSTTTLYTAPSSSGGVSNLGSAIKTGKWYLVEVRWDTTSKAWEFRLDGNTIASGTDLTAGAAAVQTIVLGCNAMYSGANYGTVLLDDIGVSSTGFVGTEMPVHHATLSGTVACTVAYDNGTATPWRRARSALQQVVNIGDFWHDTTNGIIYTARPSAPTDVDAASQAQCGQLFNKNNVTVRNVDWWLGAGNSFQVDATVGTAFHGCTFAHAGANGFSGTTSGGVGNNGMLLSCCTALGNAGCGLLPAIGMTSGLVVHGCVATDNCWDATGPNNGGNYTSAGIKLFGLGTVAAIVEYCHSYANGQVDQFDPLQNKGAGIWIDTCGPGGANATFAAGGSTIRYNNVHDNAQPGLMLELCGGHQAYGNLIYRNGARTRGDYNFTNAGMQFGIHVSRGSSGNLIANNTVYDNGPATASAFNPGNGAQFGLDSDDSGNDSSTGLQQLSVNNVIQNNIFLPSSTAQAAIWNQTTNAGTPDGGASAATVAGNVYGYNCLGVAAAGFVKFGPQSTSYATYAAWETALGASSHSVQADPLLGNPSSGDFRLQAGSPVIGSGLSGLGIPASYSGTAFAATPAVGAYDYP